LKKIEDVADAIALRFRFSRVTQQGSDQKRMEQLPRRSVRSSIVLPIQAVLDQLADRVERAYKLRRPRWLGGCSTERVWYAASLRLWEAHAQDPKRVPLDAELFVASQPISVPFANPWIELAQPESVRRYRMRVRQIIRQLGSELRREVRLAERLIQEGNRISSVLRRRGGQLSALGRFIVALRAGRVDLAERLAAAAAAQHRSCPLYRAASRGLISADCYPRETAALEPESATTTRAENILLSLN
jgi:hypothetical protein